MNQKLSLSFTFVDKSLFESGTSFTCTNPVLSIFELPRQKSFITIFGVDLNFFSTNIPSKSSKGPHDKWSENKILNILKINSRSGYVHEKKYLFILKYRNKEKKSKISFFLTFSKYFI